MKKLLHLFLQYLNCSFFLKKIFTYPHFFKSTSLVVRTQLIIFISLVIIFFFALTLSLGQLDKSFKLFEQADITQKLKKSTIILEQQTQSLKNTVKDYALWDDTYSFAGKPYDEYVSSNFTSQTLDNNDIDFVLIMNPHNEIIYNGFKQNPEFFDLSEKSGYSYPEGLSSIPSFILNSIISYPGIFNLKKSEEAASGIIFSDSLPILIGVSPILQSDGQGKAMGVMIMGKVFTEKRLHRLHEISYTEFHLFPSPVLRMPIKITIHDKDWEVTEHYPSLLAHEGVILKVFGERTILRQLKESQWLLMLNFLVMMLIFIVLVSLILYLLILKRITFFAVKARTIRKTNDISMRMPVTGHDELDELATAINELLHELHNTQERLMHDALYDSLTGLGNRTLLMDRIRYALAVQCRDPSKKFAVFLMDLDNFKNINDLYGHPAGDYIIRRIANRIKTGIRETDTAVRFGGDEFIIIQTDLKNSSECEIFAQRLLTSIQLPIVWQEKPLQVSVSIGIFFNNSLKTNQNPEDFIRDADIAMYKSKQEGKNSYSVFHINLREKITSRLTLEQELKRALENDEMEVWYQPIISSKNFKINELEALVRWRHPSKGLIYPDEFIPLAEESDLIVDLDRYVLSHAMHDLKHLRTLLPNLKISINFSVKTLLQKDISKIIENVLHETLNPACALNIEITETGMTKNEKSLIDPMGNLNQKGIHFYLDDFGIGYSSLYRLHILPVQVLKLDRFFTSQTGSDYKNIVEAIIMIAKALNKPIIAEGVENKFQFTQLLGMGCDFMQGYYFARPMPLAEITKLIKINPQWNPSSAPFLS